jgi:hypothetical protein
VGELVSHVPASETLGLLFSSLDSRFVSIDFRYGAFVETCVGANSSLVIVLLVSQVPLSGMLFCLLSSLDSRLDSRESLDDESFVESLLPLSFFFSLLSLLIEPLMLPFVLWPAIGLLGYRALMAALRLSYRKRALSRSVLSERSLLSVRELLSVRSVSVVLELRMLGA